MATRKRRTRRRQDETVYYVIEIERWDWGYSFGVNNIRTIEDPYLEFRHLEIEGKLLRPGAVKVERAGLVLMPDKRLNEENRARNTPKVVGSLNLHKGMLQGLLSMPSDALGPVLQMLIAGRLDFAVLEGTRLHYRHGTVKHLRLDGTFDEDDLPPEDE